MLLPDANTLPTLVADRIVIRPLAATDVPAVFEIFGNPEVARYGSSPALTRLEEAEQLVTDIHTLFAARSLFQWGIALRDNDAVIGTCTLAHIDTTHRRAEIGFALARAHWRRGYVAEALPKVLEFAFEVLGCHRIEADVDPRNTASLRTLERAGFQREGYLHHRYFVHDEWHDSVMLGLLAPTSQ